MLAYYFFPFSGPLFPSIIGLFVIVAIWMALEASVKGTVFFVTDWYFGVFEKIFWKLSPKKRKTIFWTLVVFCGPVFILFSALIIPQFYMFYQVWKYGF